MAVPRPPVDKEIIYVHLLTEKSNEMCRGPDFWQYCAVLPYYVSLSVSLLNINKIMNLMS